jgi:hypothetical protein
VLPVMSVSELGVFSDDVLYELGPRTLIGVKGIYVYFSNGFRTKGYSDRLCL